MYYIPSIYLNQDISCIQIPAMLVINRVIKGDCRSFFFFWFNSVIAEVEMPQRIDKAL